MPEEENYYKILGVGPDSDEKEIREVFRTKAKALHPDILISKDLSEELISLAEREIKKVNEAYATLSDKKKRRQYDENLKSSTLPIPRVDKQTIDFGRVDVGKTAKASFVVKNDGGSYQYIFVSNPDSWVKVTKALSLSKTEELPLKIEIEVEAENLGQHEEIIEVRLDDVKTSISIKIDIRKPQKNTSPVSGGKHWYGRINLHSFNSNFSGACVYSGLIIGAFVGALGMAYGASVIWVPIIAAISALICAIVTLLFSSYKKRTDKLYEAVIVGTIIGTIGVPIQFAFLAAHLGGGPVGIGALCAAGILAGSATGAFLGLLSGGSYCLIRDGG